MEPQAVPEREPSSVEPPAWGAAAGETSNPHSRGPTSAQSPLPSSAQVVPLAVGAGHHVVAGAFQRAGEEAAQGIVVFGKEDAGHGGGWLYGKRKDAT